MVRKWDEVQAVLQQRRLEEALSTRGLGEEQERNPVRPGAVWWVAQACSYASVHVVGDVNARALCAALRDYARVEMKTEEAAKAALNKAGIRSSEDLGRVVFAMIA